MEGNHVGHVRNHRLVAVIRGLVSVLFTAKSGITVSVWESGDGRWATKERESVGSMHKHVSTLIYTKVSHRLEAFGDTGYTNRAGHWHAGGG